MTNQCEHLGDRPMAALTARSGSAGLDPQLVDLISESLVWSDDAAQRAATVVEIIAAAADIVRWRVGEAGDTVEEAGLDQVLTVARQHLDRMRQRS